MFDKGIVLWYNTPACVGERMFFTPVASRRSAANSSQERLTEGVN